MSARQNKCAPNRAFEVDAKDDLISKDRRRIFRNPPINSTLSHHLIFFIALTALNSDSQHIAMTLEIVLMHSIDTSGTCLSIGSAKSSSQLLKFSAPPTACNPSA